MAVPLRRNDPERKLTKADLAARVQRYVEQRYTPPEAVGLVLADLRQAGLADALLELIGPPAIRRVWRTAAREVGAIRLLPSRGRPGALNLETGERRIDVKRLAATSVMLEGLWEVNGRWVRLGDLTKTDCLDLATVHRKVRKSYEHNERFFDRLAKSLEKGQTVRQRWNDAGLLRLFDLSGAD